MRCTRRERSQIGLFSVSARCRYSSGKKPRKSSQQEVFLGFGVVELNAEQARTDAIALIPVVHQEGVAPHDLQSIRGVSELPEAEEGQQTYMSVETGRKGRVPDIHNVLNSSAKVGWSYARPDTGLIVNELFLRVVLFEERDESSDVGYRFVVAVERAVEAEDDRFRRRTYRVHAHGGERWEVGVKAALMTLATPNLTAPEVGFGQCNDKQTMLLWLVLAALLVGARVYAVTARPLPTARRRSGRDEKCSLSVFLGSGTAASVRHVRDHQTERKH